MSEILIDYTDYVETQDGSKTLKFSDEKQQARFELGVCMAVYKWDALDIAVSNQWGGSDSDEKRDWISGLVVHLFLERIVDVQLIEETMLYAMSDEFDTQVEDDSALPIAALIIKIYRECSEQNYTIVEDLYAKWQAKQSSKEKRVVDVQEDPNNPDVSDEEDDEEHDHDHGVPELVSNQDSMEVDEPQAPVVDDDGFELVQKKGKGRRH